MNGHLRSGTNSVGLHCRWPWLVAVIGYVVGYHLPPETAGVLRPWSTLGLCLVIACTLPYTRGLSTVAVIVAWAIVGICRRSAVEATVQTAPVYPPSGELLVEMVATVARGPVYRPRRVHGHTVPGPDQLAQVTLTELMLLSDVGKASLDGSVTLYVPAGRLPILPGDRVHLKGSLSAPVHAGNPGLPCTACRALRRGTIGTVWCPSVELIRKVGRSSRWWWYLPARFAARATERFRRRLPPRTAALVAALVTGETAQLPAEAQRAFREAGVVHLLAVSGLHLGIVAAAAWFPLRLLGIGPRTGSLLVLVAAALFTLQAGARPATVRALIMLAVYLGSFWAQRPPDRLNTLALAALGVLLVYPDDLGSLGFVLSFASVATLIWLAPPLLRVTAPLWHSDNPLSELGRSQLFLAARGLVRSLVRGWIVSAAVGIITLPVLAARGYPLPVAGILLTPLLLPAAAALIVTGLLHAVAPVAALPCLEPFVHLLATLILDAVERCDAVLPARPPTLLASITAWAITAAIAAAAWAVESTSERSLPCTSAAIRATVAAMLAALLGFVVAALWLARPWRLDAGELRVTVLNVRHGLAVLVRYGRRAFLYDAGSLDGGERVAWIVRRALQVEGIEQLDLLVVSHADVDHMNGIPDLLESVPVAELWHTAAFAESSQPVATAVLQAAKRSGARLRPVGAGDRYHWVDGVQLRVLHPPRGVHYATDNESSLVLEVGYAGRRLLLTGDIERWGLADLLARNVGRVDLLLSPHHGSRRANPPELFEKLDPAVVIVSREVRGLGRSIDRRRFGPWHYVTGMHGAVTVRIIPGQPLQVETWKHGGRRPEH